MHHFHLGVLYDLIRGIIVYNQVMDDIKKEQLRPYYYQLQGLLAQAPENQSGVYITDPEIWNSYDAIINSLNTITGEDFVQFKVKAISRERFRGLYVGIIDYRSKVNGLISFLYGKYYSSENAPGSTNITSPTTVITQNQHQSQYIHMALEINSLVERKLLSGNLNTEEKGFFEKLKSTLASISSVTELVKTISTLAANFNLNVADISRLFS